MFDNSPTWSRISGKPSKVIGINLGYVPDLDSHEDEERGIMRWAVTIAIVFHIAVFLVTVPGFMSRPLKVGQQRPVFVIKPVRFQPPPARQEVVVQRQTKKRRIPIPDPTPDDPEPIRLEEIEMPDVVADVADLSLAIGIPDAPPSRYPGDGNAPVQVGGDVSPPVKVFGPQPAYTEDARKGRIQGIVILEAIIDVVGNVTDVKVLKGLPLGLTESAVATTKEWKFRPATRNGQPVAVFFNLSIRFSLQ